MTKKSEIHKESSTIALYCAQTRKCAVTGKILEIDRIHLHHKTTIRDGGTDEYRNLIMLDIDVHRLIHATKNNIVRYSLITIKGIISTGFAKGSI